MKKLTPHGFAILLTLIFSIVGCASNHVSHEERLNKPVANTTAPPLSQKKSNRGTNIEPRIRAEYERWKNTPHKFAGNDLSGVDCSGLVYQIYNDLFQLKIKRSTATQIKEGIPIKRTDLKAGDLVFFKLPPSPDPRHVGIYLSNGEFMHTSESKGVIISTLSSGYWSNYYYTARRHSLAKTAR